jgi:hypothetical protein
MTLTLLCHAYNEAYLMEAWVRHHLPLCDHAIIIDYASTDGTPEIVRDLAPQWTVVQSRNAVFRAADVDREVMQYEQGIAGWKLALNVTEFAPSLRPVIAQVERDHPGIQALGLPAFVMVEDGPLPEPGALVQACHHGYADDPDGSPPNSRKFRYLHKAPHGNYAIGRHGVSIPGIAHQYDVRILWWGFAPMAEQRRRKLQVQTRIPEDDRVIGHGRQHLVDAEAIEQQYQEQAARAYDLRDDPVYRRWFG